MSEIKVNQVNPRVASGTVTFGASGDSLSIPSGVTLTVASGATITNNGTDSGFGLFASYAMIADQKAQGTDAASSTSGTWTVRELNTEIADPDGIVSISSNQFTLGAGSYFIKWWCTAWRSGSQQTRLYNVTDSAVAQVGNCAYNDSTNQVAVTPSTGVARVVIASSKAFRIEHYTSNSYVFCPAMNQGTEQYAVVEIFKEV